MRYLAIDPGEKRTGLAVGDDQTAIITPLKVIEAPRGSALIESLLGAIMDQSPGALVVGLPLNMDGTEGPAARAARLVGEELARRAGLPIHFQDERLSSFAAEEHLKQSGRTHRQKREIRDALAAAEILRDFLAGLKQE
jgi:putative Holliday junction resolvase